MKDYIVHYLELGQGFNIAAETMNKLGIKCYAGFDSVLNCWWLKSRDKRALEVWKLSKTFGM